jgi:hypothetical protein
MFLCILLPPLCYTLTLNGLGRMLQRQELSKLQGAIIRNQEPLYRGQYTVKEEIQNNIRDYLRENLWSRLGLGVDILVKTKDDRILYPSEPEKGSGGGDSAGALMDVRASFDYMEIASDNFQVLNEGLIASVNLHIRHNSWFSNVILGFYVLLSASILTITARKRIRESINEDVVQKNLTQKLSSDLARADEKLKELQRKEEEHRKKIQELHREKQELTKDIDGLMDEMERQESGFLTQKGMREELESEILRMREELARAKEVPPKPTTRKSVATATQKRLRTLYKNLVFTDKALNGFLGLPEEHQLKAEEIVYRLNHQDAQVNVRRKVFGKGGKMDVLETDFSYSGRIYFQKDPLSGKTKIIAVGTKNSQERDLAQIEAMK